jgi:endonuclease YncB( thermonuclease family)
MKTIIAFLLILQLCSCGSRENYLGSDFTGKVVAIADGDTFTLLTSENNSIKIRLHGIDCPEKKQDFGQVAKQKLSDLVFRKNVRAIKKDVDRYGRTIALVYDEQNNCVNVLFFFVPYFQPFITIFFRKAIIYFH